MLLSDHPYIIFGCVTAGEVHEQVQSRGDAECAKLRNSVGERRHDGVAASFVAGSEAPQMSVQLASRHERGEGQLFNRRRCADAQANGLHDRIHEWSRDHEPSEPYSRCQRLAGCSRVHHTVDVETLECSNRLTVVTELAVVIVLDDEPIASS